MEPESISDNLTARPHTRSLRYPSFSSYLGGTASRNNSIFLCEYNFAFNLFSPLFPSLARSLAKIPTAVDRLSLPSSTPSHAYRSLRLTGSLPPSLLSLALLTRVSLRFFHSEPSSPPLTSVYGELAPSDVLLHSLISRRHRSRRPRTLSPSSSTPSHCHAAVRSFRSKHSALLCLFLYLFLSIYLSISLARLRSPFLSTLSTDLTRSFFLP